MFVKIDDDRDLVTEVLRELDAALERVADAMPDARADETFLSALGYIATKYAQHYGHAETVRVLTSIARQSVQQGAEELAQTRH